ncbi:hypothetical protein BAE44_0019755 [Dichanthelium oligosanthes]|uniref:HMA domain-containing protein n=1 Tax=Dichanthelium oligosanthes TaxID=888268 RepID=A0A1E5V2F1_9POAL|nr:hypothetical protein BAE44_0019755 [Dichanthelium oligosanthes]
MKVAAAIDGVESVTLSGKDKSLLRVVGDGVDCNYLTTRLRRKVGHADVVELRTLHGGSIGAGYYGSSSRASSLTRDAGYGGSSYGSSYPSTMASYAPEYYGQQQQPSSYGYYPAPYAAAPTVVHHEYYPPSADPNGCSIILLFAPVEFFQKEIIIRMHVKSDKCQAKAMKVAAAASGVESVTLAGGDKSLLLVIGTGVDSNKLVKKLKKKVGEAEIVELRTHDTFEAAALPLPGTKQEVAAMRSPYNSHNHQWQYNSYAAVPTSPYAYHYYPSPVGGAAGGHGYGYGYGARVSSYSLAAAQSHPANYSPLVERHDYQPMDKYSSSSSSSKRRQTMAAVPRRGSSSGSNSCAIL